MPATLTPNAAALDDLGRANIKRILAGRRLEFFGADPGTRERLASPMPWRRCWGSRVFLFPKHDPPPRK